LSIEGPSKADIDCKDRPDGTCAVSYKPTQPGTYVISIKFAEEHVPGMWRQLLSAINYLMARSNLVYGCEQIQHNLSTIYCFSEPGIR